MRKVNIVNRGTTNPAPPFTKIAAAILRYINMSFVIVILSFSRYSVKKIYREDSIKKLISISILKNNDIPKKYGIVIKIIAVKKPVFSSFNFVRSLKDKIDIPKEGSRLPTKRDSEKNKFLKYVLKNINIQKYSGGLSG